MLVLRISQNIEADLSRNYSTFACSWHEAESAEAYEAMICKALGYDTYEEGYDHELNIVEIEEGVFALKHHDWLASTELGIDKAEFLAMDDESKEEFCTSRSWGEIVGVFEHCIEYPSFDAEDAELVWSDGTHHVFEVSKIETETSPAYEFLTAMESINS